MPELKHDLMSVNGIRLHTVEAGEGPLVLLVHGFPELWYSWRHQFAPLADAGYRVVAYDQRGFGRSSKLWDPLEYRITQPVQDALALVSALGEKDAIIIGHDWGAPVAWIAAWLYPEVFRAVMGMSVPFSGRGLTALPGAPFGERRPTEMHRIIAGEGQEFYQDYFGTLRGSVREIEADARAWYRQAMYGFSAEPVIKAGLDPLSMEPAAQLELIRRSAACVPFGSQMKDRLGDFETLPDWLTEADLDYFVAEYERTGFAGGLSYYHAMDAGWEELEHAAGKPIRVPAYFLGGQYDAPTLWGAEAVERAREHLPELVGSRIVPGAGHWIQQEKPAETNAAILEFLQALR